MSPRSWGCTWGARISGGARDGGVKDVACEAVRGAVSQWVHRACKARKRSCPFALRLTGSIHTQVGSWHPPILLAVITCHLLPVGAWDLLCSSTTVQQEGKKVSAWGQSRCTGCPEAPQQADMPLRINPQALVPSGALPHCPARTCGDGHRVAAGLLHVPLELSGPLPRGLSRDLQARFGSSPR